MVPGPWWAEMMRSVADDPVSPFNAAFQDIIASIWTSGSHLQTSWIGNSYQPATGRLGATGYGMPFNQVSGSATLVPITYGAYLDGTVTITNGSTSVVGSGTHFLSEVEVGDLFRFSLSSTDLATVYTVASSPAITNTTFSLTTPWAGTTASGTYAWGPYNRTPSLNKSQSDLGDVPYSQSISIEGWATNQWGPGTAGTVTVTHNSSIVTGSGTSFLSKVVVGDQYCFNLSADSATIYTVLSIQSDTQFTLTENYHGTTTAGTYFWGPFNRPPTIELSNSYGQGGSDTRILALMPDTSGIPKTLYEDYDPYYDPVYGWYAYGGGCKFNLVTGEQRFDGLTSTTAGGTPCLPFLTRYEEAANPPITHPLRGVVGSALSALNQCVWPALHGVGVGVADYTLGRVPQGARLRLNAAWWAANRATFSDINKAIGDCMATYGLHVNDLTSGQPIWVDGAPDSRWDSVDVGALGTIPSSAFELVDTIKPSCILSVSSLVTTTGTPITVTLTYTAGTNTNFGPIWPYVYWSDDGSTWHQTGFSEIHFVLSDSSFVSSVTWTPPSSGNCIIRASIAGNGIYWVPPVDIVVAVSATSRALTSSQAGRWDNPATWGGVVPPGPGDSATVAHAVLMVGDVTLGTGAATTCLTVATGTLTVIGCKLTLRGNTAIGQVSVANVTATPLTVLSSAGNAAGIELDGNSGVTPTITVNDDTLLKFTGTPGAHAFLRTASGTAGNPGFVTGVTSTNRTSFYAEFRYTDFTDLGTATSPAMVANWVAYGTTDLANPPWIMDHCTVTGCGFLPKLTIYSGAVDLQFTNSSWDSPADPFLSFGAQGNAFVADFIGAGGADPLPITTGGVRLIDQCVFTNHSIPICGYPDSLTITNNFISDFFAGGGINPMWALFDGNFMHNTQIREFAYGGNVTNCFLCFDPPSAAIWPVNILSQYGDCYAVGNVLQAIGLGSGGGSAFSGGESHPNHRVMYRYNNICLPSDLGDISTGIMNADDNPSDLVPLKDSANHNTVYFGTGVAADAGTGGNPCLTGGIVSFKNNLFWTDTPQTPSTYHGYVLTNAVSMVDPYDYPDPVDAADCDYNAAWNANLVPMGTWTSAAPAANGTLYNIPMTTANGAPGAHDIVLDSAPPFFDATRNLQTWAVAHGYANSGDSLATQTTKALAAIKADPTLTKTSLVPWIQAGFTLVGSGSLVNSASDNFNRGYDPRATG